MQKTTETSTGGKKKPQKDTGQLSIYDIEGADTPIDNGIPVISAELIGDIWKKKPKE